MSEGFATYRGDTTVITSTERSGSMVFVEFLELAPGSSGSKTYPGIHASGLVTHTGANRCHDLTITVNGSGQPVLNWSALPYGAQTNPTQVAVMARRMASSQDVYGVNIANEDGEVFVSSEYPSAQFVGILDFNTNAESNQTLSNGYKLFVHTTTNTTGMSTDAHRLIVMGLPDSGSNDTWYSTDANMIRAGWINGIALFVYTKATSYKLPRLFVFAVNQPTRVTADDGMLVFGPDNRVLYDAGAENMAVMDLLTVSYPALGNTNTVNLNTRTATHVGVTLPSCTWSVKEGNFYRGGAGVVKKVGNQLSYKLLETFYTSPPAEDPPPINDSVSNLMSLVVDLTYLGFVTFDNGSGGTSQSAPVITEHPVNRTVVSGTEVGFSVTATGNPAVSYQWYRGTTKITSATGRFYYLVTGNGDNGAQFRCEVRNSLGFVFSNYATLTVTQPDPGGGGTDPTPTVTPVGFSYGPSNTTKVAGNPVTFSVSVYGTEPITFQWYKNNVLISGATSASYTFTAQSADNGAQYHCVAKNGGGAYSATSSKATLTVTAPLPTAPVITLQPTSMTVDQYSSSYLRCEASPADRFAWYRNDAYYADGQSLQVPTNVIGTWTYHCVVYNGASTTTSSTATVTVRVPPEVSYPSYNNFSGEINVQGTEPTFSIDKYGFTSTGKWANGSGSGNLYVVRAAGDFTVAGAFGFNTTYDFANISSLNWGMRITTQDQAPGTTKIGNLYVDVYLKGGGVVASGNIRLVYRSPGTVET